MAGTALITSDLSMADLTPMDGEPRVLDTRLAEALGFLAPHRIRALVRRHLAALTALGEVSTTAVETSAKGGRPGEAYWLTKKQALYVCTKSETEKATEATIRLVEVYDAVTSVSVPAASHATLPRRQVAPSKGIGVVKLDRVVWFDTKRRPLPGELALVAYHDGRIGVDVVSDSFAAPPEGLIYVENIRPDLQAMKNRYAISEALGASLIGAVITGGGKPRRARALPRRSSNRHVT